MGALSQLALDLGKAHLFLPSLLVHMYRSLLIVAYSVQGVPLCVSVHGAMGRVPRCWKVLSWVGARAPSLTAPGSCYFMMGSGFGLLGKKILAYQCYLLE